MSPSDWLGQAQSALFESVIQPVLFGLGTMEYVEDAFKATEWLVIGACEMVFLACVMLTVERIWPAEHQTRYFEKHAVFTDFVYTCIHRLGIFPLVIFFSVRPLVDHLEGELRLLGINRPNLETLLPGLTDQPLIAFFVYLLILDFADYWIHRAQHASDRWWQLHALHHSQRTMTVWSDNRNHLLDDWLRDGVLSLLALVIGIAPEQYLWLVVAGRVVQSLHHANTHLSYGWLGNRLVTSPWFHRLHHAIGEGHEGPHKGCNFAVLFPVWDLLFRTADMHQRYQPTGIRDQLTGAEYGNGFWQQQWLGIKRLVQGH